MVESCHAGGEAADLEDPLAELNIGGCYKPMTHVCQSSHG